MYTQARGLQAWDGVGAHNTTDKCVPCKLLAYAFMQANSLLRMTNHPSQQDVTYRISYKDSSLKFNHGLAMFASQ